MIMDRRIAVAGRLAGIIVLIIACTTTLAKNGTNFRVDALEDGKITGTMVNSPQEIGLEVRDFRRLDDVQTMRGTYQALSGVARRAWAAQHADTLHDCIRAYVEVGDWLANAANTDEAATIYARHITNATEARALKASPVTLSSNESFQPSAEFDAAGAAKVLEIRSKYGRPWKDLHDRAYVDERFDVDVMKGR